MQTFRTTADNDDGTFEREMPDSGHTPEQILLHEELKQILNHGISA